MLDKLVLGVKRKRPKVNVGDFDAWATEWGRELTNPGGRCLLEAFEQRNVILANGGFVSVID